MSNKQTIERLEKRLELLESYREENALELQRANGRIQVLMHRIERMDKKRLEKQNDLMNHLSKVSELSKPHNMRAMRIKADLSLGEVQSETGISKSVISRIENGKTKTPSWNILFKLILFYESYEQHRLSTLCERNRLQKATQKAEPWTTFVMYNDHTYKGQYPD